MIHAETFMQAAQASGFSLFAGVPCSYLQPFINFVIDSPDMAYIGATNEGDAVAIASGAALSGRRAAVMFQNSGFGNAVNPLSSLNAISRLPVLVITTWRGEPGGARNEPQHDLMGKITPGLFDLLQRPYERFPEEDCEIDAVLERATRHMTEHCTPYGLIMRKDAVAKHPLKTGIERRRALPMPELEPWPAQRPTRREALTVIRQQAGPQAALLATTGFIGRALYALGDAQNQFYMVGSMGCVSSMALGLAWAEPARRVVAIDGDGAALMRLGALATIGCERPSNLIHVLLDNEVHDSTGGQATVSHSVDIAAIAHACGYPDVRRAGSLGELAAAIADTSAGPRFIHVKTAPGETNDLPRPSVTPAEVTVRFSSWLDTTRHGQENS